MTSYGPVHTLIVRKVGDPPYDRSNTDEFELFRVVHPGECKAHFDEVFRCTEYDCGVGWNQREIGLRWSLAYSGCPITEPGTYQIQAWADTIRGFDYVEYDGGVGLVTNARAV